MKYEVAVIYAEKNSIQNQIYKDLLNEIIKKCLSEVMNDEQSNHISAGID